MRVEAPGQRQDSASRRWRVCSTLTMTSRSGSRKGEIMPRLLRCSTCTYSGALFEYDLMAHTCVTPPGLPSVCLGIHRVAYVLVACVPLQGGSALTFAEGPTLPNAHFMQRRLVKRVADLELDAEVLLVDGGREAVGQQQHRTGALGARAHQVALGQRRPLAQRQPPIVQLLPGHPVLATWALLRHWSLTVGATRWACLEGSELVVGPAAQHHHAQALRHARLLQRGLELCKASGLTLAREQVIHMNCNGT